MGGVLTWTVGFRLTCFSEMKLNCIHSELPPCTRNFLSVGQAKVNQGLAPPLKSRVLQRRQAGCLSPASKLASKDPKLLISGSYLGRQRRRNLWFWQRTLRQGPLLQMTDVVGCNAHQIYLSISLLPVYPSPLCSAGEKMKY